MPHKEVTPWIIKNMYLNINKKMLMKLMTGTTKLFLILFFSQHGALNQFLLISLFSQRALQLIISQISLHAVGFKQRANLMQKMAVPVYGGYMTTCRLSFDSLILKRSMSKGYLWYI